MLQTFELDIAILKGLYKTATAENKTFLENKYGKEIFNQKITDRIKTFEDACVELALSPVHELPYLKPKDQEDEAINAAKKLFIICRALNEGWTPDWTNSDQYKYYPWFEYKAGFGFSYTRYVYWSTRTFVGSRLCFHSSELAEYAGEQFIDIYNKFLTIQ